MKIGINAHLIRHLVSGVEYYVHDLVGAIARRESGHEYVLYLNRAAYGNHFTELRGMTPATTTFSNDRRLQRIAWEQCMLPFVARRDKLDLLHSPAYVVPVCSPVPTIATIPDVIALKHPEYCRLSSVLYARSFLPVSARRAKRIITLSECSKRDILKHLTVKEDGIEVIPLAADEMFRPVNDEIAIRELRAKYGLPRDFILFVGNLEPKKNVERLIEAFHVLKRERSIEHALVIVGNRGISYGRLRAQVEKLGLERDVRFMGYLPRGELPVLYTIADVFVFPSLYEGFGLPPLEALSCGTPVVASGVASLPEIVGEAAVLIDPYDVGDLVSGIFKVLTSPGLRDRLIQLGRGRAAEFSWQATADRTVRAYEKCSAAV